MFLSLFHFFLENSASREQRICIGLCVEAFRGQRCPDCSVSSVLLTYRVDSYLLINRDLEPEEFYLLLPLMKAVLVA